MSESYDHRNARASDPETSHEGTRGINLSHRQRLEAFYREHDRPEGWTYGEVSDSQVGMEQPNIWRRCSDLLRDGILEVVRRSDGQAVTRVYRRSGRAQRAYRIVRRPPDEDLARIRRVFDRRGDGPGAIAEALDIPREVVILDLQWIEGQLSRL
jgi:hypothetical protein